jgi:peptide chain release factor 1
LHLQPLRTVFETSKEIILEIQFGEGGEDSKLFTYDLFTAYTKYSEKNKLNIEILNSENGHIVAQIKGNDAGKLFKNETGKHIVQRVPPTETRGRRQTSVVSVAVLPVPPDNMFKPLPDNEIETILQCGGGPGGQHTNKSAVSVRMKHLPTGLNVFIIGRSQLANKREALKILTAKVNEQFVNQENEKYNYIRRTTLGNGSRGNKIRTYNFIEHRLTDHRTNKKIHNVDSVFKNGSFELFEE